MDKSRQDLALQSIAIENDFSSASHAVDSITYDQHINHVKSAFLIPDEYHRDVLRLLPINVSTYFVYWEISQATLQAECIDLKEAQLFFQVLSDNQLLHQFTSSFALGEYFIHQTFENIDIEVAIGLMREGSFVELMRSNPIRTFSSQMKWPSSEDEIWLTKGQQWTELTTATQQSYRLRLGESPLRYLEALKRLSQNAQQPFGSSNLHQGDNND